MPRAAISGWRRSLLTAITAAAGIAISVFLFQQARTAEGDRIDAAVRQRAQLRATDLAERIHAQFEGLSSIASLFAGGGRPTAATFEHFVRARATREPQAIRSMSWVPAVKGADRAAFEADARILTGLPDFALREAPTGQRVPSPARPVHYPILFSVAFDGQEPPLGFDAAANELARQVIEAVRDIGAVRAGAVMQRRAGDGTLHPVITVSKPIYRGETPVEDVERRRERFLGIAFGVFGIEPLLSGAIRETRTMAETLFLSERQFADDRPSQAFAVLRPGDGGVSVGSIEVPAAEEDDRTVAETIDIAGRTWHLLFRFSPAAIADLRSDEAVLRLAIGLLVTLLATLYVGTSLRRVERLRESVDVTGKQLSASYAELAAANAHLATVIDSSPVAIVGLDGNGNVASWNRAAAAMLGYRGEEVIGKPLSIVSEQNAEAFADMIARARSGETLQGVAIKGRRKDGDLVDLLLSAAPLGAAETDGVLCVLMDVSERRRMERQLHQAQKMEAVGQLTGGLAHDFNNLLSVIIGNLDLISDRLDDRPDLQKLIEIPMEAALKGADLNRALLAFSRRQTLEPKRVEVAAVIRDMAKLLQRTLGENIVIDIGDIDSVWPVVIDPAQLESALLNLAVNARDAMPQGGRLSFAATDLVVDEDLAAKIADLGEGDYVRLSVTDTGTGMTPEVLARAFEPFFTTKDVGMGTGLGLAQVFGFAKQSGGTVRIYSEPGHGTTVNLYLPRAKGDRAAARPAERGGKEPVGKGETVLVVEDNAQLRNVVELQLGELGFKAVAVGGTEEALDVLRAGRKVDLLFTDIVMPGKVDGRRLAAEARDLRPDLKVLFTSGFANASQSDSPELPGKLLSKPYRKRDLAMRVRETLDA